MKLLPQQKWWPNRLRKRRNSFQPPRKPLRTQTISGITNTLSTKRLKLETGVTAASTLCVLGISQFATSTTVGPGFVRNVHGTALIRDTIIQWRLKFAVRFVATEKPGVVVRVILVPGMKWTMVGIEINEKGYCAWHRPLLNSVSGFEIIWQKNRTHRKNPNDERLFKKKPFKIY